MLAIRTGVALLLKESLSLLPHWLGMVALANLFGLLQLFSSSLTLAGPSERVSGGSDAILTVFLLAFACGHAMLGPEFTSRHVEFLDGLPVRRWQVYAAKVTAAALPSVATLLISLAWDLGSTVLSPGAPGASPYDEIVFAHALLAVGAAAGTGLGLLFSWVGALGWGLLVLGLVGWMIGSLILPPVRPYALGVGSMGGLEFVDGVAVHPVGPVVFWLVVTGGAIAFAGLLFLGPGGRLTERGSLATGAVRVGAIGCSTVLLFALAGLSSVGLLIQSPTLIQGIVVERTADFRILYRAETAASVAEATRDLDALSRQIGEAVGNPDPVRLDLEFLGATDNHAGLFTGGKIRLQPRAGRDVVAHELVHAHSFAVSGPAAWQQSAHTRFFEEGLASWVAARMEDQPTVPPLAAAIHLVDPVPFDLLVEDTRWVRERDIAQPYPIGIVFHEALDQVGPPGVRACLLREIGAVGDREIAGLALWVGLMDRCGVALEDVVERFEQLLLDAAADLPPLPAVEARLDGTDLVVTDAKQAGMPLICRFRSFEDAEVGTYVHIRVQDDRCALPLWNLSDSTFGYQVGFEFGGDAVFDRWVEAPTPR
jgi:hypothetical protein